MIKVSVIIPVYNVELYLEECLDSIIGQSLQEIEIICVNDGSTDSSLSILYKYAQTDNRIQIINQSNKGQSSARNVGLGLAKGVYIYFMDSDDILDTTALYELYKLAKQDQLEVLYFDASVIYENEDLAVKYDSYMTTYSYIRKHNYNSIISGASMFTAMYNNGEYRCQPCMQLTQADYIRGIDLRFLEGIFHEDHLFYFLCIIQAARVSHLNKPYFVRRIRVNSTMTQTKDFRHFYGYFTCFTHIISFAIQHRYENNVQVCITRLLDNLRSIMVSIYSESDAAKSWLEMLTITEQYFFSILCQQHRKDSISISNRSILLLPRKLRGGFRCIKEHGLLYTIRLAWKKLHKRS